MLLSLDWTLQLPLAVGYLLVVLVSLCLVAGSDGGQSLPLGRLGIFLFVDRTPSLLDRSVEARSGCGYGSGELQSSFSYVDGCWRLALGLDLVSFLHPGIWVGWQSILSPCEVRARSILMVAAPFTGDSSLFKVCSMIRSEFLWVGARGFLFILSV